MPVKQVDTFRAAHSTYRSMIYLYGAKLVINGPLKYYLGTSYDDDGRPHPVVLHSTEFVIDGQTTWTEAICE